METKNKNTSSPALLSLLLVLTSFWPLSGESAPLCLTPEGPAGNPNDGLGMSVEELRKQLDDYWTAGDFHNFYKGGQLLVSGLNGRLARKLGNETAARDYIEAMVYILSHDKTTAMDSYGLCYLVDWKGQIGKYLIGGDYLHFISDGKYRGARIAVTDAGIKLMDELRNALKAEPPLKIEVTAVHSPSSWKGEPVSKEEALSGSIPKIWDANRLWNEQRRLRFEASAAIGSLKDIPELLKVMETEFVAFTEREYRRAPPEKGEMESIIARAGLPKNATERLKKLIPR